MRASGASDKEKAFFLIGHLDGITREKVEELEEPQRSSFAAVVQHLSGFFERPQQRVLARQSFTQCSQGAQESAGEFGNRIIGLVRAALAGQTDAAITEYQVPRENELTRYV